MTALPSSPDPQGCPPILGRAVRIGLLALLVALGLELLGWIARLEDPLTVWMSAQLGEALPRPLPVAVRWGAALVSAFGLPLGILASRGAFQRMILWLSACIVMLAWAPVLSLAAYQPEVGLAGLVTFGSGAAALWLAARGEKQRSSAHHEAS